ncbi:MAG: 1-acyl-sn-glycerol-3-phosphate acyltransferase [Clostridia bacterium]|nr:1-acyl-sn-glycerol-3-phosphate acyltransferase [Clostridia bacterium]
MNLKENNKKKTKNKKKGPRGIFRYWLFDFTKITGAIPALLWLRPKFIYENKAAKKRIRGKAVLASNHVAFQDPVLLHCFVWYRRLRFLAGEDLYRTPRLNFFFSRILCIKVERKNFNFSCFKEVVNELKAGHVVGIFPEGHIEWGNETPVSFKSGAVMMAIMADAPIVPVYIVDRQKWYQRAELVVGEPMRLKNENGGMPSLKELEALSEQLREKELQLKEFYEERRKKKCRKSST